MSCLDAVIYQGLQTITGGKVAKHEKEKKTVFYFFTELQVILILAFTGGYVDAVGYIKCAGLFTSSITGNLVVACSSIYATYGVVARVCVTVGFLIGGLLGFFVASRLKHAEEWSMKSISALLYLFEVLLFLVTFAVGLNYDQEMFEHGDSLSDWRLILTASIMGGSMGMHNAAAKESIPNVPATTVMTMTLVSESMTLSQLVAHFLANNMIFRMHPKDKQITAEDKKKMDEKLSDAFSKWVVVTRPFAAFIIGAIIGCAASTNITYYSLLISSFMVGAVVLDICFAIVVDRVSEYNAVKQKADEEEIVVTTEKSPLELSTLTISQKGDQERD